MLKPYNKQAIIAAMKRRELLGAETKVVTANIKKQPSILDISKWPQWWEQGAKELEQTSPGRIITAPLRLPEAVITSTTKSVQEVPAIVKGVKSLIPVAVVLGIIAGVKYVSAKTDFFKTVKQKVFKPVQRSFSRSNENAEKTAL